MDLTWKERRTVAYLTQQFDDQDLPFRIEHSDDQQLAHQVLDFFANGSQLVYPAKYVFCAIVYAYFLHHYFGLNFRSCLENPDLMPDSPTILTYGQKPNVYDYVLQNMENVERYPSIQKTVQYFKQEFLIHERDDEHLLEADQRMSTSMWALFQRTDEKSCAHE